ncbi:MAG: CPBP family intramembrane metalloprotease, partial [Planctomycetota bacterium]
MNECSEIRKKILESGLEPLEKEDLEHLAQCEDCFEFFESHEKAKPFIIVQAAAWMYTSMIFFALLWIYLQTPGLERIFKPLRNLNQLWEDFLLGSGIALIVILFSRISVAAFSWAKKLEKNFRKILGPLTLYQTFLLGLFSALGEELFFRGAMQYSLGLVATSIIFGFLHVMPSQEKHWYQRFSWTIFAI